MIMVDTGVFLALFSKRDRYHDAAKKAFGGVSEPLITTYPVITETCYMLTRLVNQSAERRFLSAVAQNVAATFHLNQYHLERMVLLMEKYEDLPIDITITASEIENIKNSKRRSPLPTIMISRRYQTFEG